MIDIENIAMKNNKETMFDTNAIRMQFRLLGHKGYGVTELRIFDPIPMVAYADNEDDAVRLVMEMAGKTIGIYVGVQPRPLVLFDKAPNCWRPASRRSQNCATDNDIEYITTIFFDIDVVSEERQAGHPASELELQQSLKAAELLCREDGLALSSTICCSGNGHYVLAPTVAISVDSLEVARQFKRFCQQKAQKIAGQVKKVRVDPVFNLSRVMRVIGSKNLKGQATPERPHRQAYFVTGPTPANSMSLHYMIRNTEVECCNGTEGQLQKAIRCDLQKIENCEFIQWCRQYPVLVTQPLWFGLITNLAHLEGGPEFIHQISALDKYRYDYADTARLIRRVIDMEYKPVYCRTLIETAMACPARERFCCSKIGRCHAKSPMYLTTLHPVYER